MEDIMLKSNNVLKRARKIIQIKEFEKEQYKKVSLEIEKIQSVLEEDKKYFDKLCAAYNVIGGVADIETQSKLDSIVGIINQALSLMFKEDSRSIKIKKKIHAKIYPHYVVELTTSTGKKRTFNQSGSGLAQIISFLFLVCLIDVRGSRKIVILDELLNGLHPIAKEIFKQMMGILSKEFQFIMVEYGFDYGKQYEVKKSGVFSNIERIEDDNYYESINIDSTEV